MKAGASSNPPDAGRTPEQKAAEVLTSSALPAALLVSAFSRSSTDPVSLLQALREKADELDAGSLVKVEGMLLHQAIALQTMFMDLALRAKDQKDLAATQALMQLALKAQSGSRATLQTLGDLKNPRPVFVRQTNVAQTQQVNNGGQDAVAVQPSRARKPRNAPIELKAPTQECHGSPTLDTRATTAAGRADSAQQAMGAFDRAPQRRR